MGNTVAEILEAALEEAGFTHDDFRFELRERFDLKRSPATLISWLHGRTEPKVSEYDRMAAVINERLKASGSKTKLPLIAEGSLRGRDLNSQPTG